MGASSRDVLKRLIHNVVSPKPHVTGYTYRILLVSSTQVRLLLLSTASTIVPLRATRQSFVRPRCWILAANTPLAITSGRIGAMPNAAHSERIASALNCCVR